MKNLKSTLIICVLALSFTSCSNDDNELSEIDSIEENQIRFESLRKEFATKYSESTIEITKDLELYKLYNTDSKNALNNELTFNDFVSEIPESENLTNEALILLEPSFNFANENQSVEELVNSFGAEELYSISLLYESWEDENLTEEEAVNKLLYLVDNDFVKSDCKFFCKVWNGIKAAARWVWKNYKEITTLVSTGISIYALIDGGD